MKKKLATAIILASTLALMPVSGPSTSMASGEDTWYMDQAMEDGAYEDEQEEEEDDENDSGYYRADPTDWNSEKELITSAIQSKDIKNVDIFTGDSIEVPADILSLIAGKDVTLALHAGNGLAFGISGKNVSKKDTALSINLMPPSIPEYRKQEILTGTSASYLFTMKERNVYPIPISVHVNMGAENAGKVALLYSYAEADNSLRLMGSFRVTESGQAMFGLHQGGEYIVVVADKVLGYTVREGDTLSHIAVRHKIPLGVLKSANPQIANISRIRVGQTINIPIQ